MPTWRRRGRDDGLPPVKGLHENHDRQMNANLYLYTYTRDALDSSVRVGVQLVAGPTAVSAAVS